MQRIVSTRAGDDCCTRTTSLTSGFNANVLHCILMGMLHWNVLRCYLMF